MTRSFSLAAVFLGLLASSMGRELVATVDRSRIDGAGGAGGVPGSSSSTVSSSSTGGTGGSGGATSSSSGSGGGDCVPVDDSNPCTDDVCENGAPVHKPTPAGSACSMGGTLCDGKGRCAECLAPTDCVGPDDADRSEVQNLTQSRKADAEAQSDEEQRKIVIFSALVFLRLRVCLAPLR
jgi:hypothetical protein